jgi:protein-export membrane protein SecD
MDQFGVSEPSIRQTFDGRISIELPGLDNPQLIRDALSKVGRLEFHLVDEDTMAKIQNLSLPMYQGALVSRENLPADFVLPEDSEWYSYWENDEYGFPKMKGWFVLKKAVEMDGTSIDNARADMGQRGYVVPFQLNERGTDIFSELTGANIGRRLAIVLDGKVKSAPNIQSEINGSGEITGSFTFDEAIFLANVLKAGSLPVKLDIAEERVIGPSLGRDSIEKGLKAFLIGTAAVVLFMLIWYKVSGFVAVIGLAFNMFFLVALLGFVNATLTLSGIAGIALTVGMAVDANVLIYERIREEMKRSRSYKHALENGYHMASKTIWDANLTTLIASLALYVYGTGSIKGFGITLTFGIISNIFAALFVTRLIFDWLLDTFKLKKISV